MKHILFTMALALTLVSAQAIADSSANSGSNSGASAGATASGGQGGQGGSAAGYGGQGGSAAGYGGQGGVGQGGTGGQGYGGQSYAGGSLSGMSFEGGKDGGSGALATNIDFGDNNSRGSDMSDNAPGVFSAGVTAGGSNPCVVSVGGGVSGPGYGVNFARAYNDGECQIRESLRLMVAILPNNNDTGSQMLIRETACQSDVYWQSMERVYIQTNDDRFLCTNPRPDNKPIAIRDRAVEKVNHTASKVPVTKSQVVSNYNSHPFLDF